MSKKYSADDIKLIKPNVQLIKTVDLSRDAFKKNLYLATDSALKFARTLVIETLHNNIRYLVCLDASSNASSLEENERLLTKGQGIQENYFDDVEKVVKKLWRGGYVPEWINISVTSVASDHTLIKLECCGRFTDKAEYIYHNRQELAPFHVTGPPIPPEFNIADGSKYSLEESDTL